MDRNSKKIICVGREYGSGGKEIGVKLSQKLQIPCYDKELLAEAAKESGIVESVFETHDEKFRALVDCGWESGNASADLATEESNYYLSDDKIYLLMSRTITHLAEQGPCIFIGRCAAGVLEERKDVLSVFIHAERKERVKRISEQIQLDEKKAEALIKKTDRQRAHYHNHYAVGKWGEADTYDMTFSSSSLGIETIVSVLEEIINGCV